MAFRLRNWCIPFHQTWCDCHDGCATQTTRESKQFSNPSIRRQCIRWWHQYSVQRNREKSRSQAERQRFFVVDLRLKRENPLKIQQTKTTRGRREKKIVGNIAISYSLALANVHEYEFCLKKRTGCISHRFVSISFLLTCRPWKSIIIDRHLSFRFVQAVAVFRA